MRDLVPTWARSPARLLALAAALVLLAACAAARPQPPPHWRVVALGDSVTSGAACGCTPFPEIYARELSRRRHVPLTVQNFGSNGQDSGGLRSRVEDPASSEAEAVRGADIVIVTIGANDFASRHHDVTSGSCTGDCLSQELGRMRANVQALLRDVRRLRHGLPTAVLVTGYWNVFEDGEVAWSAFPEPGRRAALKLTLRANQAIRDAARTTGSRYVDLYRPFNGPASQGDITGLLAGDGDHPDARGHRLIARVLLTAGLPGLTPG